MAFDSGVDLLAGRLELIGLDAAARARLAANAAVMNDAAPVFIAQLYEHLRSFPETAGFFTDVEQTERLARLQREHLVRLLDGDTLGLIDERRRIGVTHHRIGISPQMYFGAYSLLTRGQVRVVFEESADPAAAIDTIAALVGVVLFDAGVVLDAYEVETEHAIGGPAAVTPSGGGARLVEPVESVPDLDATRAEVGATAAPPPFLRRAPDDAEWRCRFLQINEETKARLRRLSPIVDAAMPRVLADFYDVVTSHPQIPDVITPENVARLMRVSATFWHELTLGEFDRLYATSRMRVGLVHERIGVSSQLYLAGLARQLGHLIRAMPADDPDVVDLIDALLRAVFFDVTYLVDAYMEARVEGLLRSAETARDSRVRLDHLIGSISGAVWELDLAASVIRYISTPIVELVGRPDAHFVGRPGGWDGVLHPVDEVRLARVFVRLRPGDTAAVEHRLVHADGHEVLVRTHARRIDAPTPTIIGVTVDVGEIQAERLRRELAIGNLAGGVAHELNNALSAVYGHLAVLGRLVHDPRAQRSLAAAEGAAARAADVTARLLSFAGRQVLDVSSVNLNDVVRQVVPVGAWPTGRVQVEHHLDPELAPCQVDHGRAAAALGELVVNALEAMTDGGVLLVSTANVVDREGAAQVEVAVTDVGRGMTPDERARAVEPFFTTKPIESGAGLGLSTVYGFVSQSHGELVIESVEGAGTVARMRFPGDRRGAIEETIAIGGDAPSGRVLLIDTDPMLREVTVQILTMLGLAVTAADSVNAALEAVRTSEYDFLVAGATIGRYDGVSLAADLIARQPALGVVVISEGSSPQVDLARLGERSGLVAKPFSLTDMMRALRSVGWAGPSMS